MKTMNITQSFNQLRIVIKHSARAVVTGCWLVAGTALAAPPVNDDFANSIVLPGVTGTQTGTNTAEATFQVGEPVAQIFATLPVNTVWFKWTCPADGQFTVYTNGSTDTTLPVPGEWDAILGIYSGAALNALTPLGATPKDTTLQETMTVAVTAGNTYHIQLAGYDNSLAANVQVNWDFVATIYQADILSFGPGAVVGEVFGNAAPIGWILPFGTNRATLAPTFTLSPGATCTVGGLPVVSGSTVNLTNPVVFTVTAQGASPIVNAYTVTVTLAPNESALVWDTTSGDWDFITPNWLGQTSSTVQPFFNALNVIFNGPTGGTISITSPVSPLSTTVSAGNYVFIGQPITSGSLTKSGSGNLTIRTVNNTFNGGTIINAGQLTMDVQANAALGTGPVTLNGGRLFLERITAANALIVNGGNLYPDNGFGNNWNGPVTLNSNLIIQGPGYAKMTFNGSISGTGGLTLNGQGEVWLQVANSYTGPTSVTACKLQANQADALGSGALSISSTANSKVNLNYSGTRNVSSLTLGGVSQSGGTYGSSASPASNQSAYFDGTGTVTVPPSSAKNMLTFSFGVLGAATVGDTTISLEVPFGTNRSSLAPTYTVSPGATASPASGPPARNFTGAQTYTVTAEDGSTKDYLVTVSEAVLPNIFTWAAGTSGDWSVAANWTNEEATVAAPLAGGRVSYTLNFDAAGTYTSTNNLNAGFLLNQLNLGSAVTLAGNGLALVADGPALPTINQNSGSPVSIATNLDLGANTTYGGVGSGQVNLTGLISGAGSLTKNGSGTLGIFNVNNSFTGGTTINSGTLRMDINAKLGTGPVTLNGGTIFLWRFYPSNDLTVNGGTLLSENGFGNSWNGPITLNTTLVCNVFYTLACTNTISGVGGLTKNNSGPMILSGTNTYSGPTTVTGGKLQCNNPKALGGGALSISGGKLNLNYTGTRTVASLSLGGTPKTAPGTYGSVASLATFPDDTYFEGNGTVTVGGDYDTWLSEFTFPVGADTTATGDPDGDGVTNQQEYAFGLNPTLGSSVNPIIQQLDKTTGNFQYTRRATPAATKLTYIVRTSTNLANWATGGATETGFTTAGGIETVTVNVTAPAIDGKMFVRVEALPAP